MISSTIASLAFNNTATSPIITWSWANTIVSGTLTITKGLIDLGTGNSMTLGTSVTTAGTLSLPATATTGFISGKYIKWFGAASVGSAFSAGANPAVSPTEGRIPMMSAAAQCRHLLWNRTAGSGTGGKISCTYNDANTISSVNFSDGTYLIDKRTDFNWVISNEGTTPSGTNINILVYATGSYVPITTNSRIVGYANALPGATQAGVITPHLTPRRTGFTSWASLTTEPLYVGISRDDLPFTTMQDGSWDNPSTWQNGYVPDGAKYVLINHNVTISSGPNVCKNLTLNVGGTLTQSGGTLSTVGTDYDNVVLVNGGVLDIQGGTLNVLGKLQMNGVSGGNLKQSGGEIIVDGNSGSGIIPSTASNLVDFYITSTSTVQLTGGTMTIVDPSTSTSATPAFKAFIFSGSALSAGSGWTLKFGNGTSTDAGGSTAGFYINLTGTTYTFGLGNLIVDIATGTNRLVTTTGNIPLNNLTINNGEYRASTAHYINGNIVNNGTLTSLNTLAFSGYNGSAATTGTVPQSIGGTGVFRNSTSSSAVNFIGLTINNTGGITFNRAFNMSGILTLTNGKVNTTTANLLLLESASTVSPAGGSAASYINGPMAKNTASTTAFAFPIGKNTIYRKVTLTPSVATASTYTAEFFDTPYSDLTSLTAPIKTVHSNEYFDLTGTNPAKVALSYDFPVGFATNAADLSVAHYTGGSWVNEAATATNISTGVVTTTAAVTTWSPFAVGSFDAVSSPLPITLKSFTASENGAINLVHWETAAEQNVRQFIVEKSADAKVWNQLGITPPTVNKRYDMSDENPTSTTYYRLRNIDIDGRENTSNTIVVNRKSGHFALTNIAPNPTDADINVKFEVEKNTSVTVTIVDIFGKTVLNQKTDALKGFNNTVINTNELPTGAYFVNINNGEKTLVSKIIKN